MNGPARQTYPLPHLGNTHAPASSDAGGSLRRHCDRRWIAGGRPEGVGEYSPHLPAVVDGVQRAYVEGRKRSEGRWRITPACSTVGGELPLHGPAGLPIADVLEGQGRTLWRGLLTG